MAEPTLESLVGLHQLDAVDTFDDQSMASPYDDETEYHGSIFRFRLDGVVYTAREDDNDGYRSAMRDVVVGGEAVNVFPAIQVLAVYRQDGDAYTEHDLLQLYDTITGKLVVEVGTRNADDYYPSFVGAFWPENMATNAPTPSDVEEK